MPRIEDQGSEESSLQVVGFANRGGVGEGMHPRLHVPLRLIAGYVRGHQKPYQAAKHSDGRDDEWRIEEVIASGQPADLRCRGLEIPESGDAAPAQQAGTGEPRLGNAGIRRRG